MRGASGQLVVLLLTALGAAGCDKTSPTAERSEAPQQPVEQVVTRGPLEMRVSVDRDHITIADKLQLTIEVQAEDGIDVEMPQFAEKLDEFTIRDYRSWAAVPRDGRRLWKQQYDIDIYLSGEYHIPAMTARFTDRRDSAAVIEGEISTEPITITVSSLLEGEFDPATYRDIKGPVELPAPRSWAWAWWLGGTVAGLVALVLCWLLLKRRRTRFDIEPVIPAHEWALERLRQLRAKNLVEQGQVHEFHFELSDVVRQYIERRFSLMAPERTTEEFLVEMRRHSILSSGQKAVLQGFLEACDKVKFALYEPAAEDVERTFDSARGFVEQTASDGNGSAVRGSGERRLSAETVRED